MFFRRRTEPTTMVDRRGIFRNAVDLAIRDAVSGYRSTDWALFGDVAADLEVRAAGPASRRVTSAACLIASSNVRQRPGSFSYEGQRRYGATFGQARRLSTSPRTAGDPFKRQDDAQRHRCLGDVTAAGSVRE